MESYSTELITKLFGRPIGCSQSIHFVDGQAVPILVVKNEHVLTSEISIAELRSTLTVEHMNASLGLINSPIELTGTRIGLELPVGALIDFADVYAAMISSLAEKGIEITFFLSLSDGDVVDFRSEIVHAVIDRMIQLGCDFAVDKIQNAEDFRKVEHFFELITQVRLNSSSQRYDEELIAVLSAREITAIQDIN